MATDRKANGEMIALMGLVKREVDGWKVHSQSGDKIYLVNDMIMDCTCPDNQQRHAKCKHIIAVEIIRGY